MGPKSSFSKFQPLLLVYRTVNVTVAASLSMTDLFLMDGVEEAEEDEVVAVEVTRGYRVSIHYEIAGRSSYFPCSHVCL